MQLFLGTIENKIDIKGRISIPADYRSILKNNTFKGVILYHSFVSKCIEGCTLERMEQMANASDNLDLFSEKQDEINSLIFSDARKLAYDTTGRILIPKDLLNFAEIKDNAIFVGCGKTFQIWNKDLFLNKEKLIREKAKQKHPSLSFKLF